jgi:hypothetical protein
MAVRALGRSKFAQRHLHSALTEIVVQSRPFDVSVPALPFRSSERARDKRYLNSPLLVLQRVVEFATKDFGDVENGRTRDPGLDARIGGNALRCEVSAAADTIDGDLLRLVRRVRG